MAAVFSGNWHKNNQSLIEQLTLLKNFAFRDFEIEISVDKMLEEKAYRELVIDELSQLSHHDINKVIHWLTVGSSEAAVAVSSKASAQTEKQDKTKKTNRYALLFSLIIMTIVGCFFWFNSSNADSTQYASAKSTSVINDSRVNSSNESQTTIKTENNNKQPTASVNETANTTSQNKNSSIEPPREVSFRLHGSNTIGEKLAPMLVEGFLKQQGIDDYSWTEAKPLERVLHYRHQNKNYSIELHSHGSSTAFSSLKAKTADIGMASRRIKDSEVTLLSASDGQLNKLGNEHIIGLDGLAVIVNQNNAVKELTSQTLAKIFSGEITNWSQVGGDSAPIALYARDQHSGTWDTFKNLVLKKNKKQLSPSAVRLESSSELSTLVSQNEHAIGFIGLNYVLHNKAVAIAESRNAKAIFPTRFTVGTEDYALSRRLYFYTPTGASMMVKDFAQYALSNAGQEIVSQAGLISQNIKQEDIYPLETSPKKYKEYAKIAKRLSLNFRFDYATKDLDNKGKRDLQRLVAFMEKHPSKRLVLMGFSDSIGAVTKNTLLSLKRAKSVEQALTARGVPVLAVEGMGEALPIANNNIEAGRKRNRRVEVWLL